MPSHKKERPDRRPKYNEKFDWYRACRLTDPVRAAGVCEFLRSLDDPSAKKRYPDFKDALGTQYVCDAVLASAKDGAWKSVKQV